MAFQPGHARVGGRKSGVPDKRAIMKQHGLMDAIEMLRGGKANPIAFQQELNELLRRAAILRAAGNVAEADRSLDTVAAQIARLNVGQARLVLDYLVAARDGWYRLTQFAYPKLSQVDIKDALAHGLLDAAKDGGTRVEYTRRIMVESNGKQYEQSLVVDVPAANGGGR